MSDLFSLSGKSALITGSPQGIGSALAKGLAEAGAKIILNGRDIDKLAKAAAELGSDVNTLTFDVTDHLAVRTAVDSYETSKGAIGVLVTTQACSTAQSLRISQPMHSRNCCKPMSPASFMSAKLSRVI